jgi:hypothetical protein
VAAYNDAAFRAQFPAFASQTAYPPAALQFAWDMGGNWVNLTQASWGIGSTNPAVLQQAADLMAAVILVKLYGCADTSGNQTTSAQGDAPGPVSSASEGSVSASFTLPQFGSSAFSALLLSAPPYGPMLLALIQISASIGPYIGSGRMSWVPP